LTSCQPFGAFERFLGVLPFYDNKEIDMNRLLSIIALLAISASSFAATETAASSDKTTGKNTQQEKMASCNKEATGKKGEERKAFMKECLSDKPSASAAQLAQRDKMKDCNAQAKDKKGEERKSFMKTCLSSDTAGSKSEEKKADKPTNTPQPAK
jgi:Ni/Co efflux regulator RcnB